jgi:hypothetical protein
MQPGSSEKRSAAPATEALGHIAVVKRYLWNEKELLDAIAYVLYDQGEPLDGSGVQNRER